MRLPSRRGLLLGGLVLAVGAPLARLGWLWSRNNRLPPVAEPEIAIVGNWVLDRGDLEGRE